MLQGKFSSALISSSIMGFVIRESYDITVYIIPEWILKTL